MMARIKKNDTVMVLTGKDRGKKGTVIDILPKKGKVIVKDINLQTHFVKARKQGDVAGIKKKEGYINLSNVMPICSSCKKPCRVNAKKVGEERKVRICNQCKEVF